MLKYKSVFKSYIIWIKLVILLITIVNLIHTSLVIKEFKVYFIFLPIFDIWCQMYSV